MEGADGGTGNKSIVEIREINSISQLNRSGKRIEKGMSLLKGGF